MPTEDLGDADEAHETDGKGLDPRHLGRKNVDGPGGFHEARRKEKQSQQALHDPDRDIHCSSLFPVPHEPWGRIANIGQAQASASRFTRQISGLRWAAPAAIGAASRAPAPAAVLVGSASRRREYPEPASRTTA